MGNGVTSIYECAFRGCDKLKDVYYFGNADQWNKIYIEANNYCLKDATRHYYDCGVSGHIFDNDFDIDCDVCGYTRSEQPIPSKPTYSIGLNKKVTIKKNAGYLYSIDGENFTENNIFENLEENVIHSFYRKSKANENYIESDISEPTKVIFISSPKIKLIGATKLELYGFDGFEYSLDGIEWQDSPMFTRMIPEETYTVYQRLKNTDNITVIEIDVGETNFETSMYDSIEEISATAEQLVFIVDSLLKDKKEMASDVNGDALVNILDLVSLKKNLANNINPSKNASANTSTTVSNNELLWKDDENII